MPRWLVHSLADSHTQNPSTHPLNRSAIPPLLPSAPSIPLPPPPLTGEVEGGPRGREVACLAGAQLHAHRQAAREGGQRRVQEAGLRAEGRERVGEGQGGRGRKEESGMGRVNGRRESAKGV